MSVVAVIRNISTGLMRCPLERSQLLISARSFFSKNSNKKVEKEQERETESANVVAETTNMNGSENSTSNSVNSTVTPSAAADGTIKKLMEKIADLEKKLLYSMAEVKTIQNRSAIQVEEAREYGATKFMKDIFEVSDILDNALKMVPKELLENEYSNNFEANQLQTALNEFIVGIQMTQSILDKKFEQNGVKKDNPIGQLFDPNFHYVKYQIPYVKGGPEPSHIADVMRVGYIYHKRVLRAAEVGVVKKN